MKFSSLQFSLLGNVQNFAFLNAIADCAASSSSCWPLPSPRCRSGERLSRWPSHLFEAHFPFQRWSSSSSEEPGSGRNTRRLPSNLEIFKESLKDADEASKRLLADNVHLNPAAHWDAVNGRWDGNADDVSIRRFLSVCVLGVPNAGKSTLVNSLCQSKPCPVSSRTHTTRRNRDAILTEGDAQLVLWDTPGLVSQRDVKDFKLEKDLLRHPERGVSSADLVLVVQDVSNRYVREAINKDLLKLLCRHVIKPSILVLNKVDTLTGGRNPLDLIRKLTCNHLEGVSSDVFISDRDLQFRPKPSAEAYLKARETSKRASGGSEARLTAADFLKELKSRNGQEWSDEELGRKLRRVVGWPGFSQVFSVSSVSGEGIANLRSYLLATAVEPTENRHTFASCLHTTANPKDVVLSTVKAKLLDVLPQEIPYALTPELNSWTVYNGTLCLAVVIRTKRRRETKSILDQKVTN